MSRMSTWFAEIYSANHYIAEYNVASNLACLSANLFPQITLEIGFWQTISTWKDRYKPSVVWLKRTQRCIDNVDYFQVYIMRGPSTRSISIIFTTVTLLVALLLLNLTVLQNREMLQQRDMGLLEKVGNAKSDHLVRFDRRGWEVNWRSSTQMRW